MSVCNHKCIYASFTMLVPTRVQVNAAKDMLLGKNKDSGFK